MKKLIIIGASGFGREVAWLVNRINTKQNEWEFVGFIDDNLDIQGQSVSGHQVLGRIDGIEQFKDVFFICAVGNASTRKKIISRINLLTKNKAQYANLIDPSVPIVNLRNCGTGNIICAGSILTTDYSIGNHVIINLSCTVGHDAIIRDYVTLYPTVNVSGNVVIDECGEIGTGSQIIQGKTIGKNSVIGAGSVVVKDIPANCIAVGVPAKPIKFY